MHKIISFGRDVRKIRPKSLNLVSNDKSLAKAIQDYCKKKINYNWSKTSQNIDLSLKIIWKNIPSIFRGIIFFANYFFKRKKLKKSNIINGFLVRIPYLYFLALFILSLRILNKVNFTHDNGKLYLKHFINSEKN